MTIARRRLRAQRLIGRPCVSAPDVVGWMGAVQAQDYGGAKWGLAQRTSQATEAGIDSLVDAGAILRTHVLRPTWHFVLPADIRWLLELTGPRVKAATAFRHRQLDIDAPLLRRSHTVLELALRGGSHRTRGELGQALEEAGIAVSGQRLPHLLMDAELNGVIVSGPRRGRQFTYALLEERAPQGLRLEREQALAELTLRYFKSHGPAQVRDFAWWSGLTLADVRRGLALAGRELVNEIVDGKTYWSSADQALAQEPEQAPALHLLPNYDELLVAYRDRTAAHDPARSAQIELPAFGLLGQVVVIDGRVCGAWKRERRGAQWVIEPGQLASDGAHAAGLERARADLARFLGVPVTVI